jgi:hypothetical protein
MSKIVERLTENIVSRDLAKEGSALLDKWEATGLLEGLGSDKNKGNMARLLENQAKELLREASTMAAGDVEGFAAVAFPIVRRVFGGLIANDLVSVQPMSLPSGLIFFMDFQVADSRIGYQSSGSLYGGGKVGAEITGGVDLTGVNSQFGFYNLNNGYSSPVSGTDINAANELIAVFSGAVGADGRVGTMGATAPDTAREESIDEAEANRICQYDPDLASGSGIVILKSQVNIDGPMMKNYDKDNLAAVTLKLTDALPFSGGLNGGGVHLRRLNTYATSSGGGVDKTRLYFVINVTGTYNKDANGLAANAAAGTGLPLHELMTKIVTNADNFEAGRLEFATRDSYVAGGAIGSVIGEEFLLESDLASTDNPLTGNVPADIPEIDIKVDSVAVTAQTKKLKAKWSPELGQDLNAYHNLDAEVELTSVLSEQIALEIDREIIEDLVKDSTGGKLYWSRNPGQFLNRETGLEVGAASAAPDFTGTVSEWYETLIETINDVSARIHRKTLRGGANFVVTSPEVASIMEFTAGFRASVTVDSDNGSAGAVKVGSVSKKWDIYIDPYFPRNLCLVGRKGSSFLESGYVYAPYVPLQVTPTIFGPEDFTPRKGVLTRYAKKMVRPDMYGLVIVRGMVGSSGGS